VPFQFIIAMVANALNQRMAQSSAKDQADRANRTTSAIRDDLRRPR